MSVPAAIPAQERALPDHPSLAAITAALEERERKFDRVRIKWRETKRLAAGAQAGNDLWPGLPEDKSSEYEAGALLAGSRWRRETMIGSFVANPKGVKQPLLMAFDGKKLQTYTPKTGGAFDQGVVSLREPYSEISSAGDCRGIILSFRPISSELIDVGNPACRLLDAWQSVDGRTCACLERTVESFERSIVLQAWLDPACNYAPIQYVTTVAGGRRSSRTRIRYGEGPEYAPTSWSTTLFAEPPETISGRVVECQRDAKFEDAEFTLKFPPGAHVFDSTQGSERELVVTPEGKLVPR